MCGIAGIVDLQRPPDESVLHAMEQSIAHRGPDASGVWHDTIAGLAHRRLSIIDLSPLGAQPMSNEDGRLHVIFNGEIYNHHDLRAELTKKGHTFRSRSDTEVLVHGYESWGTDLARRLRGMFAFAIWDAAERKLFLARDRLGKKPLFYRSEPGRLIFGSELNVFKAAGVSDLRISRPTFRQYLEYGYVFSPNTILEDVKRLPAGHFAVWEKGTLRVERYWAVPTDPGPARKAGTLESFGDLNEWLTLLQDAVKCRLESDVPLGCFLSGGVDSSLVASLAAQSLGRPLKTYTVGFENSEMNEATFARRLAERIGADHHELPLNPRTMVEEFEPILSQAAEPLGDDSYVPTFLISRETRRFVTVALSGDGGDELFAGYAKYAQFESARKWLGTPVPWRWLSRVAPNDAWHKRAAALATQHPLELARWLSSLWKRVDLDALLIHPGRTSEPDLFERAWTERAAYPDVERFMLTDMETYLEGDILTKVDRASMAVGLEARSPFLDAAFVDESLRWPIRAQLKTGGKAVLKRLLGQRFPTEWFDRSKRGFGMPVAEWFRGELVNVLRRYTDPARIRHRGLMRPEALQQAVDAHISGRRNFARRLYAVVAFELWADRFFGPSAALG